MSDACHIGRARSHLPAPLQDELLACLRPNIGRLVRLPNAGHFVSDEWPAFERAVREFILEDA